MGRHARLSPSNKQWPKCPGSVRENAKYPDIAGEAAIDGTGSHLLLELCMTHGVRAEAYDGQIVGVNHEDNPMGWMVSIERINRVQECLDYIARRVKELREQYPTHEITVESESKSDPGSRFGRTDWWGTVDITITVKANGIIAFIEVADYKDGRGYVDVMNNSQLISYMVGKMPVDGNIPTRMTIVQPKTNPSIRYVNIHSRQVAIEAAKLAEAAKLTDDPNAPLIPGDHCKEWCGHKPNCTAGSEQALRTIQPMTNNTSGGSLFELVNETFGDITAMPTERLTELADARASLEAVFDKVEAELQRRIETGISVEGYAMLPGNSKQTWSVSEEEVVKMLKARRLKKEEIYPSKLISPAQVLRLENLTNEQKEKISKQYIKKEAGGLKLTKVRQKPETDKAAVFLDVVQPPSFF